MICQHCGNADQTFNGACRKCWNEAAFDDDELTDWEIDRIISIFDGG